MAGVLEGAPTFAVASLLKGNKQAVPTGAALSSAGEKSLYCIEIFLCRLFVHQAFMGRTGNPPVLGTHRDLLAIASIRGRPCESLLPFLYGDDIADTGGEAAHQHGCRRVVALRAMDVGVDL